MRKETNKHDWDRCLGYIMEGLTNEDASMLAGIPHSTFYDRKKENEDFAQQVKEAEILFKYNRIKKINADKSWQSDAWALERKFPDEYGLQHKVEVNDVSGKLTAIADALNQSDTNPGEVSE